jgi:putative component of toxin-antitoxin plasmid stabilization module
MVARASEIELHDEIVHWLNSLDDTEWDRAVVNIDRLAALGPSAGMPLSRSLGDGVFELRFTLGPTAPAYHLPIHQRRQDDPGTIARQLLTTFREQRQNERAEIARARSVTGECARMNL